MRKSPQRPLKAKKAPRATIQAGCFAPAANGDDFGTSFPPRPRGRPSGRVPLEPPAFFNPSNGHPCPSPGGEYPCSPKKGETGKTALWGGGQLDKDKKGVCQQSGAGQGRRFRADRSGGQGEAVSPCLGQFSAHWPGTNGLVYNITDLTYYNAFAPPLAG